MNETSELEAPVRQLIDEYGNVHTPAGELAKGGQGVVYRTRDTDLAIKQPLIVTEKSNQSKDMKETFARVRSLPLPPRIPVSLPLSLLRDEPGYVMRLLEGMRPFGSFNMSGIRRAELEKGELPAWLANVGDPKYACMLLHYAQTGSTRRRLFALYKCAAILARLHAAGLIYGDISPNNVFLGEGVSGEVWLIDADNLRFEQPRGGNTVYTPNLGAPEVVQCKDAARPRTDCWSFAVMAFETLALCHPMIGKKVLAADENEECGWDAEPIEEGIPADPDEQAYAGFLPFIDDEEDDSNAGCGGLPRAYVLTVSLRRLFQETFGVGRTQPHRRPSMPFWALELARAFDGSVVCPECRMSYFSDMFTQCPFCRTTRPAFVAAKTSRWTKNLLADDAIGGTTPLPHRLFHPFSLENSDDTAFEAVVDWEKRTVVPVRGTKPFPAGLKFAFVERTK